MHRNIFRRLPAMLTIIVLFLVLSVALIVLRVQTKQAQQANEALSQSLSIIAQKRAAFQPIAEDARNYAQRFGILSKIDGSFADSKLISGGLTSSAMEDAARKAGYSFPGEILFQPASQSTKD